MNQIFLYYPSNGNVLLESPLEFLESLYYKMSSGSRIFTTFTLYLLCPSKNKVRETDHLLSEDWRLGPKTGTIPLLRRLSPLTRVPVDLDYKKVLSHRGPITVPQCKGKPIVVILVTLIRLIH